MPFPLPRHISEKLICIFLIFRYALKSRKAEKEGDVVAQRKWYCLMLREDSDAALLRAFECFLEAAPQQVLQLSLMIEGREEFKSIKIKRAHLLTPIKLY